MKPQYILGLVAVVILSLWIWYQIPFIAIGVCILALLFFKGAKKIRGESDDY